MPRQRERTRTGEMRGMTRRKLLTALIAAGVFTAGFGAAVLPASAEQRTYVVTLLGGKTMTVTLDVAPGTPPDQITIPGVTTPIIGITDITPAPTPVPTVDAPDLPALPGTSTPEPSDEPQQS